MPRHYKAYYRDEHGQWEEVSFLELQRDARRAELRERDLRDEANGMVQLGIRNHQETPHFYAKRRLRSDLEPGVRESKEHDDERRKLCMFLSKHEKCSIGYYERPWDVENRGFDALVRLKDFAWGAEVQFGLVYGKFVRFDIFGRSKQELKITDKTPLVAIEVVDTHFHSREAFKVLLEASKNLPLIVAYYFVSRVPHLNCMHGPSGNRHPRLRIQCYIADGSFWYRDERVEEGNEVTPAVPDVYYNFIREKLYADGLVRASC